MDYRDPIYGFVSTTQVEQAVIDTIPFWRLRRISQLGPTNLVYPTANHTRLEHSLGVLQASSDLLTHLLQSEENRQVLGWSSDEITLARSLLRLAALLHDVGHAPFSHAAEKLFPNDQHHEDYTYRIITESNIGETIDSELGDGVSTRVAEISVSRGKNAMDAFLSELLTGDIGTDRVDYLSRDSYHLGVAYGRFDRHHLFNTLFIRHNPDKGGPELALEYGGLHAVEGFLLARYFMFVDVYFHKTRRILDHHLGQFLASWLPDGKFPSELDAFLELDDPYVQFEIGKSRSRHAESLSRRSFFRSSFETVDHPSAAELVAFNWLARDVVSEFGVVNVVIDEAEKDPYSYSQPPIFVRTPSGFRSLAEVSPLLSNLETIRKKRIYSDEAVREDVRNFCHRKWNENLSGSGISG